MYALLSLIYWQLLEKRRKK
ncbi:prophage ps3 protein 4 [Lactococcus lactis subsp. lactis IO-1]|nr:prophage ps3 protein 4 [Lactococcus lactis subsp. lactis IO-1]